MVDIAALAQQAMTIIAPLLPLAASHAATQAADGFLRQPGARLYDWLASKLKGTTAGATLDHAIAEPGEPCHLITLQREIMEMAEKDPKFQEGLAALLKEIAAATGDVAATQTATLTGDNSKSVQAAGNDISIRIG